MAKMPDDLNLRCRACGWAGGMAAVYGTGKRRPACPRCRRPAEGGLIFASVEDNPELLEEGLRRARQAMTDLLRDGSVDVGGVRYHVVELD